LMQNLPPERAQMARPRLYITVMHYRPTEHLGGVAREVKHHRG
jgi:hypothetical protein